MPSSQLALLCHQIENQNTDHFGKFYMYVSLLNTLTVRNKSFADGLPKYSSGLAFWRTNHLDIGKELSVEFIQKLDLYSREFMNTEPHWLKTLYNIVMVYIRKGTITDLTYIIEQMLNHLSAMQGYQSHNQDIYDYINFEQNKKGLAEFIKQVSDLNQQLLSIADSGCNTVLSTLAVATGLVLVLASVTSIAPLVIGLSLVVGGTFGIYHYVTQAEAQAKQLESQGNKIVETMSKLPQNVNFFGNKNYSSFYAAAVKPLPYTVITALEQLMFDKSQQDELTKQRKQIDEVSTLLSI
ncbi:hypothetical protein [Legionella sp. WA2024007413]